MNKFYCKIDMRSRSDMIDYLSGHFRYHTMSSWNQSTSYANKVKIGSVIPNELQDKVYELMDCSSFYDSLNIILEDWAEEWRHEYQAGFNGRSGGYIVLYQGGIRDSDHKSYCTSCGQRNFTEAIEDNNKCGKCNQNTRINKIFKQVYTYPGKSMDMGDDFSDWDMFSLKERMRLVQSFDKMCDDVVSTTIDMANNYTVEEEEYTVVKTRKIIV